MDRETIKSVILIILVLIILSFLINKFWFTEYKESLKLDGYQQAEKDYANAKAFPLPYSIQNQTTNETETIFIAIPVCSQEFINNYEQICGSNQ